MICYRYDDKGYFTGESTCQLDPLESQIQGIDIYLLPASCTYTPPLPEREGFKIKWEEEKWIYEEIKEENKEPAPYVPTIEDKMESVRGYRHYLLTTTDFTQLSDAPLTEEEKLSYREYRTYLRDYTNTEDWYENNPLTYDEWIK